MKIEIFRMDVAEEKHEMRRSCRLWVNANENDVAFTVSIGLIFYFRNKLFKFSGKRAKSNRKKMQWSTDYYIQ